MTTLTGSAPTSPGALSTHDDAVDAHCLPPTPGRTMSPDELHAWVREIAARPELWAEHTRHDTGERHYVSLHRDADVDLWLLCWNTADDTGWHDHDVSSGAVAVTRGAVVESRPRLGGVASEHTAYAGETISFGPDHIHRMAGAVDGSVSIHAYSPPLWRMGQYSISDDGLMRRWSVSYADELRPLHG